MPIPADKKQLLDAIRTSYASLREDLAAIPVDLALAKELEGHAMGTLMSVKDLVAYLHGWGQLVLKWNRARDRGQQVDFPETGYKWNELGRLAQKLYDDHRRTGYKSLLARMDRTVGEILDLVEGKTNSQLYETAWYEKWTLGRMIQLNTSSPYQNARARVRKWKRGRRLV